MGRFGALNPDHPEFASIEAFVESLWDDSREQYTCFELQCLCARLGRSTGPVKEALSEWDLTLEQRPHAREVRGINSPNHLEA